MCNKRYTIVGFLGLYLDGIIVAIPGTFLPQWTNEFGANLGIGIYFNLFLLGSLVGIIFASKLRERHPLVAISFTVIGIAFVIAAVSHSFKEIIFTGLFIGFGDGILNLQSNSLVGELNSARRVTVLNWANAAFGLGAICTPLVGTLFSWRIVFALVALLAFTSVVLAWHVPPIQHYVPKEGKISLRKISIFMLMIMIYTGLEGAIGTWSSTYLLALGHNETLTKTLLSLYWGGLTLGRIFLGSWTEKQPFKCLSLLLVSALGVLSLCLIPSLAIVFPLAAFFYGPLFATLLSLVQESCGHLSLGYLFYAAFIGKTSIPAAFSLVKSSVYLPYAFICLALSLYILSLRLGRRYNKQEVTS